MLELGERLEPFGYSLKRAKKAFRKKTANGIESIHIAHVDHWVDLDLIVDFAIRINDLEDILGSLGLRKGLSKSEVREQFTIGAELGRLEFGNQKRWKISKETEIQIVVDSVFVAIRATGFPYFEKYSDLREVLSSLQRGGREADLLVPFRQEQLVYQFAIAYLLRDIEAIHETDGTLERERQAGRIDSNTYKAIRSGIDQLPEVSIH